MELIHPKVEDYAKHFSPQKDPLLNEIERQTARHPESQMLSGAVQGKLLEMISLIVQPIYILEIGTFVGYSALCLAKGLKPGGELHTLELREETAAIARENFKKSTTGRQIILHTGNALELLSGLNKPWDLVFIDADKPGYVDYYSLLLPRLKSGCLILADNVLFLGQVLEEPLKGKNAKAIQAFNELVLADERVDKVMLTVRDGLLMIRKK
ncbi:MAG TPA: O-methyltransferase [Puia sp.]|nr:O-methyltransferase [Puia sp.]